MADNDLTFSDFLSELENLGTGEWITAYSSRDDALEGPVFYCGLIPEDRADQSLQDPSWDLRIGNDNPGFSFRFEGGQEVGSYYRFSEHAEPLVLRRTFHGMKSPYWEVSEEFRLYFNLYDDRAKGKLVFITDDGDEEDAALVSEKEIKIKLRLVREFIAAKKMRLALFFHLDRFSDRELQELGVGEYHDVRKGHDYVFSIGAAPWSGMSHDDYRSHGFLLGKKLVAGDPDFKPKFLHREGRQYVNFIIGTDKNGEEIVHTCDEDQLANFFGKNKGAPQYITPVFFQKEVLTKYYAQPSKYAVEDGYLRCGALWGPGDG